MVSRLVVKKANATRRSFRGVALDSLAVGEKCLVAKMNYVTGNDTGNHQHPHEQCGYVISGEYELEINGEIFTLLPGDSYAIPGNTIHSFRVLKEGEVIDVFTPIREDYL